MRSTANPWFVRFRPVASPRARVFCFPFAGGSANTYAKWHDRLPPDIEVCALELPGRGTKAARRTLWTDMGLLVEELSTALANENDVPFLFFGHSMGALMAFLCARALRKRELRLPEHLFVSARRAPHTPNMDASCATMDDRALTDELRRRGGMAPQILAEPELLAFLLPIIRADFVLLNSYRHVVEPPLPCPITACGGKSDERADSLALAEWRVHTTGPFHVEMFEGGHFFLDARRDQILTHVVRALEPRGLGQHPR